MGQLRMQISGLSGSVFDAIQQIDTLLKAKIGKGLRDVFLQDLLAEGPAKEFLKDAECHIDAGEWREALLSIRKAIFVEIEFEYDISAYASRNSATSGMFNPNLFAGLKAPPIAKSIDWITLNVHTPTHFIQIDYNSLRTDALRWGVSHAELENILRLTPRVFRYPGTEFWHHDIPSSIASIGLNEEDSRYCLDRAIHILRRLQEYRSSHKTKWTNQLPTLTAPVGTSIHLHAATDSQIVALVTPGWTYTVLSESTGFDGQSYYFVAARDSKLLYSTWNGYIPVKNGTVVPPVISNPYSLI